MESMTGITLKPYIGRLYAEEGICGHRVLVLGASMYCPQGQCDLREKCMQDMYAVKDCCPAYKDVTGWGLDDSVTIEIRDFIDEYNDLDSDEKNATFKHHWTYQYFDQFIRYFFAQRGMIPSRPDGQPENFKTFWERICFYEYKQRLVYDGILTKELTEEDYLKFQTVLSQLRPELVVVWGTATRNHLLSRLIKQEHREFIKDDRAVRVTINGRPLVLAFIDHPCMGNRSTFWRAGRYALGNALDILQW